jgi:hypothetical protein
LLAIKECVAPKSNIATTFLLFTLILTYINVWKHQFFLLNGSICIKSYLTRLRTLIEFPRLTNKQFNTCIGLMYMTTSSWSPSLNQDGIGFLLLRTFPYVVWYTKNKLLVFDLAFFLYTRDCLAFSLSVIGLEPPLPNFVFFYSYLA